MSDVLEFEHNGLRKPAPKLAKPDVTAPPRVIQNLTVRDVVARLSAGSPDLVDLPEAVVDRK